MAEFTDLFKNMMWIGLIVFSVMAWGNLFQQENNVAVEDQFTNNTLIGSSFGQLNSQLASARNSSQSQKVLFETENPTAGFGTFLLYSVLSAGRVFNSIIVGIFNIFTSLPVVVLGLDPIVVSIFSTLLVVAIIFGLWEAYK